MFIGHHLSNLKSAFMRVQEIYKTPTQRWGQNSRSWKQSLSTNWQMITPAFMAGSENAVYFSSFRKMHSGFVLFFLSHFRIKYHFPLLVFQMIQKHCCAARTPLTPQIVRSACSCLVNEIHTPTPSRFSLTASLTSSTEKSWNVKPFRLVFTHLPEGAFSGEHQTNSSSVWKLCMASVTQKMSSKAFSTIYNDQVNLLLPPPQLLVPVAFLEIL